MSEFDLIPNDYRVRQVLRGRVRLGSLAVAGLLITSIGAHLSLDYSSNRMINQIDELKRQQSISVQQVSQLNKLTDEVTRLESQLSFLSGLRGGAEAPMMFIAVGRALSPEEVWFDSWEFQRAGSEVAGDRPGVSTEYVIPLPQGDNGAEQHLWMIETHMNIRGKALDHAALSRFVARLFDQREISDVRIMQSRLGPDGRFIQFDLVLIVDNSVQGTA